MQSRRSCFFIIVCLYLITGLVSPAAAEISAIGPGGGVIQALTVAPSNSQTLYAGTRNGGIFKSTDGGIIWNSMNNGLTSTSVFSIAFDKVDNQILYVGTSNGIYKSINGGGLWTAANYGLTNTDVRAVVADPTNSQVVYAGTYGGGVFKSVNGGTNWVEINTGLTHLYTGQPILYITALAIDPVNSQTVYAGTSVSGIYKSSNGGNTWAAASNGLTHIAVYSITIDPTNSQILYAGTCDSLFKSTNGGNSWAAIRNMNGIDGRTIAIDPSDHQIIYAGTSGAGILKSTNGGSSWNAVNAGLSNSTINALAISPSGSPNMYAGTNGGIYVSSNGGGNWLDSNAGINFTEIRALIVDPNNRQTVYAGTMGGLYKSINGGASWNTANIGLANTKIYSIAIDPNNSQTLYAGTNGGGLYKSTNGGADWTPAGTTYPVIFSIAVDPADSKTLYIGTWGVVYKSTDGGNSWNTINLPLPADSVFLAIDPVNGQTLYAGTRGGGLFKTTDGGTSWNSIITGLSDTGISAIAIDPTNNRTVFVGTESGVFKSTNGGASWNVVNSGILRTHICSFAIDPAISQNIYVGTTGGGVYKSTNGGQNWCQVKSDQLKLYTVYALAMDPANHQTVYIGTSDIGILKGTNIATGSCNATCGNNNGMTLTAAPASNFCSAGTATTVSGNGPWNWTCQGTNGGEDAYCIANKRTITFTSADLAGTWEANSLESPGPWWSRGAFNIGPDGSFTATRTASDGPQAPLTGTFSIASDGIVTASLFGPSFRCVMDSAKSVLTCTVSNNNDVEMIVFAKKAANYSQADLTGYWEKFTMGTPGPYLSIGSFDISSDGSFAGVNTGMEGNSSPMSGTISITAEGIIAMLSPDVPAYDLSTMRCVMDAGKTIVVCTGSHKNPDNSLESSMTILIKKGLASSYTQNDLSGVWQLNNLVSPYPWWGRGMINFMPDGSFTINMKGSDSDTDNEYASGSSSLGPDGVLSIVGKPSMKCSMDTGKRMFVCVNTSDSGDADLMVFTSPSAPVNGTCGTSNGASLPAAPAGGLCSNGSPSAVSGSGPWAWLCHGTHSGNNASCSALLQNQPQSRKLSVTISGAGTVNSVTPEIPFSCGSGTCDKTYPYNTALTLAASESFGYLFSGWSGACTNISGNCPIKLDADRKVTATFSTMPPLRIKGPPAIYFNTLPAAYAGIMDGSTVTLEGRAVTFTGDVHFDRPVFLTIKGGFDAGYAAVAGMTTIQGILDVGRGVLTVDNVIVK